MRCTVCNSDCEGVNYFLVLRAPHGYHLVQGCDHNWEAVTLAAAIHAKNIVGVAGSANCLAQLLYHKQPLEADIRADELNLLCETILATEPSLVVRQTIGLYVADRIKQLREGDKEEDPEDVLPGEY